MTAVFFVSAPALPGIVYLLCGALTIVGLIAMRKDLGRRSLTVALIALTFFGVPVALSADEEEWDLVVWRAKCESLEKYSAEWYLRRCFLFDDSDQPMTLSAEPIATDPKKPQPKK